MTRETDGAQGADERVDRLTLLETFVRVAERGGLSAAARDLDLSQPTVSRRIARLEARLGTTLLRRTTHASAPTADGLALLEDARRLLAGWEAVEERHAGDGAALAGTVRTVAPVGLGQTRLGPAVAAFLEAHPKVSIEWRLTDRPIRFAEEGCDCWIRIGPIADERLVVRELARVERLVVAAPAPARAHADGSLEAMPWLALGPFEGARIELFGAGGERRAFTVRPRFATDSLFALRDAALAGLGAAILPRWLVARELAEGALVDVAPAWRAARLPVTLAVAAGPGRPARIGAFAEAVAEHLRGEVDVV